MAAKKKRTPTLAQVRELALEKLGKNALVVSEKHRFLFANADDLWLCSAMTTGLEPELRIWAPSRSAALRALYAALVAL